MTQSELLGGHCYRANNKSLKQLNTALRLLNKKSRSTKQIREQANTAALTWTSHTGSTMLSKNPIKNKNKTNWNVPIDSFLTALPWPNIWSLHWLLQTSWIWPFHPQTWNAINTAWEDRKHALRPGMRTIAHYKCSNCRKEWHLPGWECLPAHLLSEHSSPSWHSNTKRVAHQHPVAHTQTSPNAFTLMQVSLPFNGIEGAVVGTCPLSKALPAGIVSFLWQSLWPTSADSLLGLLDPVTPDPTCNSTRKWDTPWLTHWALYCHPNSYSICSECALISIDNTMISFRVPKRNVLSPGRWHALCTAVP